MKRLQMIGGLLLIPALALFVAVSGCGKTEEKKPGPAPTPVAKDGGAEEKKDVAAKPSKEALKPGDGIIKGKVVFEGELPKPEPIAALAQHKDCVKSPENEKVDQVWIIGKDKGVANVVVYLKGKFESAGGKMEPVTLDQPFCQFRPRVLVLTGGQKLQIKNGAQFAHNTAWTGDPSKNPNGSETIQPGKQIELDFKPQSGPIPIRCDFHKWMSGAVWVFDHPYAAVTKEDGTFEIKGVPTGVEVRVAAWHEAKPNFFDDKKTFKSGENQLDLKITK